MKNLKVETLRGTMAYIKFGVGNTNPIIALHGWLDNANSFISLGEELKKSGFYAFDFLGHGLSDHLNTSNYNQVDYVFDVIHAVQKLRIKSFHLLGHSMGGSIATILAAAFPEKVKTLTLLDALGPMAQNKNEICQRIKNHYQSHLTLQNKKPRIYKNFESAILARIFSSRIIPACASLLLKRGLKKTKKGYEWAFDPNLLLPSPVRLMENQIEEILKTIQCPTLLLYSDLEYEEYKKSFMQRKKHIKKLKLIKLHGSHHFHMEQPIEVAGIIRKFLKSH